MPLYLLLVQNQILDRVYGAPREYIRRFYAALVFLSNNLNVRSSQGVYSEVVCRFIFYLSKIDFGLDFTELPGSIFGVC